MKAMTNAAIEPGHREKIDVLLGSVLKRRVRAAALTLGYWAALLIWSFFK